MTMNVDEMVEYYDLEPHPEGGFYRETYRSETRVPEDALSDEYDGDRDAGTSIVYLLPAGERSAWHRVRSDELWIHQGGLSLDVWIGDEPDDDAEGVERHTVGVGRGAEPQVLVPGGDWQSASPRDQKNGPGWSLVACVVVPGFHPDDFELVG